MTAEEKVAWESLRKETDETYRLAEVIKNIVHQDERTKSGDWKLSTPPPPPIPDEDPLSQK